MSKSSDKSKGKGDGGGWREFKCPECFAVIPYHEVARFFARIGGRKSKRKISAEEQARMQAARRMGSVVRQMMSADDEDEGGQG